MLLRARRLSLIDLRGMRLAGWFLVYYVARKIARIVKLICNVSLVLWMPWLLVRMVRLSWVLVMGLDIRYVASYRSQYIFSILVYITNVIPARSTRRRPRRNKLHPPPSRVQIQRSAQRKPRTASTRTRIPDPRSRRVRSPQVPQCQYRDC